MQKLAQFLMIASIIVCGLAMIVVGTSPAISSIYIQAPTGPDGFVMYVGEDESLSIVVTPSHAVGKYNIEWTSSNTQVATISQYGDVQALMAGTTTITAKTNNGKQDSIKLTVEEVLATTVSVDFEYSAIQTGSTYQLTATVYPNNTTNKNIIWSTSNESAISVTQDGTITAEGTGIAVITATSASNSSVKRSLTIMVKDVIEVTSLSLNHTSLQIYKGKNASLTCYVNPTNATDKTVTWSSDAPTIVSVSTTGSLTIHNAGTATITVTSANGKSTSCTVTVPRVEASSFYLSTSMMADLENLAVGDNYQLTYTCLSSKGFDYEVTDKVQWSSSKPEIASIDSNGYLTAHSVGATIITATLSGIERTVLVVVK